MSDSHPHRHQHSHAHGHAHRHEHRHGEFAHSHEHRHEHEHPHIHLVCDACGDVTSVPAGVANPFVDALYLDYGFRTDIAHVSVHGRCRACLADGAGNNADTVRG